MSQKDKRLETLEDQLADLQTRLAEVEARLQEVITSKTASPDPSALIPPPEKTGDDGKAVRGSISYAGAVYLENMEYEWDTQHSLPELLATELDIPSRALAALSSPLRLLLVRTLLNGPCNSQQLQEASGIGSPGQLYHHLKELLAAGIITQNGRSNYQLAPHKVVPFLTVLTAALDLIEKPPQA